MLREAIAVFESLGAAPELEEARAIADSAGAVQATRRVPVGARRGRRRHRPAAGRRGGDAGPARHRDRRGALGSRRRRPGRRLRPLGRRRHPGGRHRRRATPSPRARSRGRRCVGSSVRRRPGVDRTARPRGRRRAAALVASSRPIGPRHVAAPAHGGRRRPPGIRAVPHARPGRAAAGEPARRRRWTPIMPGFVCASAAMARVVEQIQRLQGQRPDGADHRRERHRQGTGGARDPHRVAAQRRDVPPLQLHDHDARARRQPAVRPPPRVVHRRGERSARPDPFGGRRQPVPRRNRRPAARGAAQAAPLPRAERDHADWRHAAAAGGRPRDRRDQRRSRAAGRRGQVPRRPLLPADRHPHPRAAPPRTPRGDPASLRALPPRGLRAARPSRTCS